MYSNGKYSCHTQWDESEDPERGEGAKAATAKLCIDEQVPGAANVGK
jgi:hypothetical protein